jgi:hypothetical protein
MSKTVLRGKFFHKAKVAKESFQVTENKKLFNPSILDKAKQRLPLHTAESFATAYVPTHDRIFNDAKLPNKYVMASEAINALGDYKRELGIRFGGLNLAIEKSGATTEDKNVLRGKFAKLKQISEEAISLADMWDRSMIKLGITQNGLLNSNENTLCIARNIISRFLAGTKPITPFALPYTSKENVFANAFDIVQMRQYLKVDPHPSKPMLDDLIARENVFYKNIVNLDDKELKEKATAVIDLADMKFEKAMTANFITDWKIKSWEQNVGKDQKDTNAEVVKRVEEKFEALWGRKLNDDECKIVSATTNNEDVMDIVPSPYEKFVIKLSKESIADKGLESGGLIVPLTSTESSTNRFKAKILATLVRSLEKFSIINEYDLNEFEKFCNSTNLHLLRSGEDDGAIADGGATADAAGDASVADAGGGDASMGTEE